MPYQREIIERAFSAKVYDSYGHMERTAAISQCPYGMYHINVDYGLVELEDPDILVSGPNGFDTNVKEIVGTSLYNLSMPLIRYRTGDLVKLSSSEKLCRCKRTFPTVKAIVGRNTDIIITPEGRAVTASYTVFDRISGIVGGQIIQETRDRLLVKIVCNDRDTKKVDAMLQQNLKLFVGTDMHIQIEHTTIDHIKRNKSEKFKVVVSLIPHEAILN
jgi:phenylacetate-CoA ligase